MEPCSKGFMKETSTPFCCRCFAKFKTDGCSYELVIKWSPFLSIPFNTILFDSEPPDVKIISDVLQFRI